jgi:hypothetical protein
MKKKYIFSLAFLSLILLLVPMTYSSNGIHDYGPLTYRDITVDGDSSDWSSIAPLVTDPESDPGVQYDMEDIKAVYGANDFNNLYFLMELYGSMVYEAAEVFEEWGKYQFYIDIIPGGNPANNSADFYIEYWFVNIFENGVRALDFFSEGVTLYKWSGSNWLEVNCPGLQGAMMGNCIEVGVPWWCIEGPACFNCYFYAHYQIEDLNDSDIAPDEEGQYIMIGCCPGRLPPVGGELLPSRMLASWLILILTGISTGVLFAKGKKNLH